MTHKKLRRSGRISKSVPILLIGSDTEDRVFSEVTHTVVLSLHGAGVVSSHKLLAEQELVLRSLVNNREAEVRVVGEIAEQGDKYTYGVAFHDDSVDFWLMEFPAPPSLEERPLELRLECSSCGSPAMIDMSRGGLGFHTKNPYLVSIEVRIAVPFSPESPNAPAIFVPARVVNITELPERKLFRCGVMFLPEPGAQAHT